MLASGPPSASHASAAPPVTEIHFHGNAVTRERVMLREMALDVGDPAEPEAIERSRQGIADLGLFREVRIDSREVEDGVVLDVHVREKRFLLPIPRIAASSDRDRSFGLQLRWNNAFGENHTLNAFLSEGRFPEDRERERERRARLSYEAPLLRGPWGIDGGLERRERKVPAGEASFDETIDRVELLLTGDFRETRPRRGWFGSVGLTYENQDTRGEFAPEPDGRATALVFGAGHDDRRFHLYSETGRRASVRMDIARRGWASDYSYRRIDLRYDEYLALPWAEHESLYLRVRGGWYSGGPGRVNVYDLGGSSSLRGYRSDTLQGQRFGYLGAEYLRPIGRDWLRLLVVAEAGVAGGSIDPMAPSGEGVLASVGVGLRLRFSWFVNFELEAGVAWPLRGGGGSRVFAGGR
jgi:outer membrane protein assembly factor BamA